MSSSFSISVPQDCCRPCLEPEVVDVPGPQGTPGAAGANGTNGNNAYTATTDFFMLPGADGASTVLVAVGSVAWMVAGQTVVLGKVGDAAFATMQVVSFTDATHVTLLNLANTATGAYAGNSAPGTIFPIGTAVGPSGVQGVPGTNGTTGAPTLARYLTQTPTGGGALPNEVAMSALGATGLLHVQSPSGALAITQLGLAPGQLTPVDTALTAGQAVFAAAGGFQSKDAAAVKTFLSLGTMAAQDANVVAVTGGTIAGVTVSASTLAASAATTLAGVVALTPSALQTVAPANLIEVSAGKVRVAGSGAPVVLTSKPTVALGTLDGQLLLVQGTSDANTVTLQDDGSLAGSKLRLGSTSRVLGAGDSVLLSWDATLGMWCEVAFTALV